MGRLARRPEWSVEVIKKMLDLRLLKKDVAKSLNINYRQLCNVMNGNVINDKQKARIIEHVEQLYKERIMDHVQ